MVDTSVIIAGIVWPRWPYEVLQCAWREEIQLFVSELVVEEAMRKFEEKFSEFKDDLEIFLGECNFQLLPDPTWEQVKENQDLMRDVEDVPIALAGINAKVDCFVSEDKDFTAKHESTKELHKRLKVILSGTFLREVMGWSSEQLEAVRGRKWSDV
jgi:predicted nucleic acid-binding protein